MRLTLDAAACMGHGRCYVLAPLLFDSDAEGHSVALTSLVSSQQRADARVAEQSCPEQALSLIGGQA